MKIGADFWKVLKLIYWILHAINKGFGNGSEETSLSSELDGKKVDNGVS